MEHGQNYTDLGKPKYTGLDSVPVQLLLPQIPHRKAWD